MLTGQYPLSFGYFRRLGETQLPESAVLVSEALRAAGFRTAAFTGGGWVGAAFGMVQGYSSYYENQAIEPAWPRVLDWLTRSKDTPFFLFLHTYQVHDYWMFGLRDARAEEFTGGYRGHLYYFHPYELLAQLRWHSGRVTNTDRQFVEGLYDTSVRRMDDYIGTLLDHLSKLRLLDNTLIILTSDHGEGLGEHGTYLHGNSLYQEVARVPLLVRFPRGRLKARRITTPVALVDIVPTILDAAGLPVPPLPGRSLLKMAQERRPVPRTLFSDFADPDTPFAQLAVRQGDYKLIHASGYQEPLRLFNLAADPAESTNLARKDPARTKALLAEIKDYVWQFGNGCIVWGWGEGKQRRVEVTVVAEEGAILRTIPLFAYAADAASTSADGRYAALHMQWAPGEADERGALLQLQPGTSRLRFEWKVEGAPLAPGRALLGTLNWPQTTLVEPEKVAALSPSDLRRLSNGGQALLALWRAGAAEKAPPRAPQPLSQQTREQLRALGYLR